jgi:hypothetical protein
MAGPPADTTELAADTLRTWAPDEDLKRRVTSTPALARLAAAVAGRYAAGETVDDSITAARAALARGTWRASNAVNRIAEQPGRVVAALADLNRLTVPPRPLHRRPHPEPGLSTCAPRSAVG